MYIALEGIDGSGKSTIAKVLSKKYEDAEFIREPGTTKFGEEMRTVLFNNVETVNSPIAIQIGMLAISADLRKYIEKRPFVIADRCFLSACYCKDLVEEMDVREWLKLSLNYVAIPDMIIYLDISADTSISRLSNRETIEAFDSFKKEEIQGRIDAYKKWIKICKEEYCIPIYSVDANKSIKEVTNEVTNLIETNRETKQCQRKASS